MVEERTFGRYTKYKKINSSSENIGRQDCYFAPLSCGPDNCPILVNLVVIQLTMFYVQRC